MRITKSFGETRMVSSGVVGLVPTMGFLHEGHLSLIEAARRDSDTVVMSLFVNPLQFDRDDDLVRYPRDLERDVALGVELEHVVGGAQGLLVVLVAEVGRRQEDAGGDRVLVGLARLLQGPDGPARLGPSSDGPDKNRAGPAQLGPIYMS